MNNSDRIIFNTLIQYIKVFFSVIISLYTSRLVLDALDASNFGIYSLVGGIVSMLSFVQMTIATTTQRYLSFYQGKDDKEKQIQYFNNSIIVQFILAISIIAVFLCIKASLFISVLNIPLERISAARFVYDCMLASLFFNMVSSSYLAVLIAHENILYSSIVQLFDAILKLPLALLLYHISGDRLEFFAIGMCIIYAVNFILYYIYSTLHYEECKHFKFNNSIDKQVMKKLLSFMGWTIYGTGCVVMRNQGFAIVLNRFLGTLANSAFGIALQVAGQINFLSSAIMMAIRPQIVKLGSIGDNQKMIRMAEITCKLSFILLCIIAIPTITKMEVLLGLWLKDIPKYTTLFCQFILIDLLVDALTLGLVEANRANGNIKKFTIVTYSIRLLAIPFAWLFLKNNPNDITTPFIILVIFILIAALSRFLFFIKVPYFSLKNFIRRVFLKELPAVAVTAGISFYISEFNIVLVYIISIAVFVSVFYFTGLCNDEQNMINNIAKSLITKITKQQ